MNPYIDLNKIEFVITEACTGKCKHCSQGEHQLRGAVIDGEKAMDAVFKVSEKYNIETVMTFGGEPLLYAETVVKIHSAARTMNVKKRQVITNGYFSKEEERIRQVAKMLAEAGVNEILVSVDAFHQETIPLETVRTFIIEAKKCGIFQKLQPAWLVSEVDDNSYNLRTRQVLESLKDTELPVGEGNVIFPSGNATKYLSEFFVGKTVLNPYDEDPYNVKCLSFSPDGNVLDGNFYGEDILEIIKKYRPL